MDQVYKTLLKSDENFLPTLLGHFSREKVALPVESFGVGTDRERTTFLIVPLEEIERPSWVKIYFKAIRPELLGLTLGQAAVALISLKPLLQANGIFIQEFDPTFIVSSLACLCAIFFTHAAACLLNDFHDHVEGLDRRSTSQGSRVIQKGWSKAYEIQRWAYVNAALAVGIGIYLLWGHWLLFLGLGALTALSILFYSNMTPFWNRLGAGDFWITLLFGPLLFFSIWVSVYSPENPIKLSRLLLLDGVLLSLCFGLLASWTFQVRQFQGIFKRQPGSFRTIVSRLNFDQARKFLALEGGLFFALQSICFYFIWGDLLSSLFLFGAGLSLWGILKQIFGLASPLSSAMLSLKGRALKAHGWFLIVWAVVL
ncbi:prenyltransferase [bacterium]|nr:prenyltransferase [bacterium]